MEKADRTTAPRETLTINREPTHYSLTPAKNKTPGCLSCPILPTIKGVSIGHDYNGMNKKNLSEAKPIRRVHRFNGEGKKDASVLVVLERPSFQEDESEEGFSGREAKLLRRMFKVAGIDLAEVRWTYAVRCCCSKVSPTAVKACNVFLANEIEKVDPDYIVPIGTTALKAVAGPSFLIDSAAGTPIRQDVCGRTRVILPIFSPGYVAVFPERAEAWREQFATLSAVLSGEAEIDEGRGDYIEIKSASKAAEMLDAIQRGACGVDIETNCLHPLKKNVPIPQFTRESRLKFKKVKIKRRDPETGKIRQIEPPLKTEPATISIVSWATEEGKGYYVLRDHVDGTWNDRDRARFDSALRGLLRRKKVKKVFWNAMFECMWFRVKYGTNVRNFEDAMAVHYLHEEGSKHSLKNAASQYTAMGRWDEDINTAAPQIGYNFKYVPKDIIGPYAGADPDATLRVWRKLRGLLTPEQIRYRRIFYPRLISTLADMQARGVKADIEFMEFYEKYTEAQRDASMKALLAIPQVKRYIRKKNRALTLEAMEKDETPKAFELNLNSTQHIRDILFDEFGYEATKTTDSGQESVDAEVLTDFAREKQCPFSQALLTYREFHKLHSTYAVSLLAKAREMDGYIHGYFKPLHVVTGRLSSADPNLQNQLPEVRRAYVSRFGDKGCIVQADYSQVELRIAGCVSGDPVLIGVYEQGRDIHLNTMCLAFNMTEDEYEVMKKKNPMLAKFRRTVAKTLNFQILYGSGPPGIRNKIRKDVGVDIPIEDAEEYINKFFRGYRRLHRWIESTKQYVTRHGKVVSPFGRIRNVPEVRIDVQTEEDRARVARAKRQAVNAVIQGAASDMTLSSLILIDRELRRRKMRSCLVLTVHDSIVLDCPISEAKEAAGIVKRIMENLPKVAASLWGHDFDWSWLRCPIVADIEVGINWKDSVPFNPKTDSIEEAIEKSRKESLDGETGDRVKMKKYKELRKAAA